MLGQWLLNQGGSPVWWEQTNFYIRQEIIQVTCYVGPVTWQQWSLAWVTKQLPLKPSARGCKCNVKGFIVKHWSTAKIFLFTGIAFEDEKSFLSASLGVHLLPCFFGVPSVLHLPMPSEKSGRDTSKYMIFNILMWIFNVNCKLVWPKMWELFKKILQCNESSSNFNSLNEIMLQKRTLLFTHPFSLPVWELRRRICVEKKMQQFQEINLGAKITSVLNH